MVRIPYLPEAAGAERKWEGGCVFDAAGAAALDMTGHYYYELYLPVQTSRAC